MSLYVIEYSTDEKKNWTLITGSYSGSEVPQSQLNEYLQLYVTGSTKAYFRTYITGSNTGSALSDYNVYLVGGMDLSFTSYYSINEHKYMCVVNRGEYNKSSNPTLYDISGSMLTTLEFIDSKGSSSLLDTGNENFHTFTTGIGLYDDSLQLVAYAKFANPIRIEKDLDSVFIVKFDI